MFCFTRRKIKKIFLNYFDRTRKIAVHVCELEKQFKNANLPLEKKLEVQRLIHRLEKQLINHAHDLHIGGINILNRL